MPTPSTPALTFLPVSTTSFSASFAGDAGVTNRLYYRLSSSASFLPGPTLSGDGTVTATGLQDSATYLVYGISDNGTSYSLPAFSLVNLASPQTTTQALLAKFNADASLLALLPGGCYNTEVPDDTELPYSFLILEGARYSFATEGNIEVSRVCFYTYTPGAVLASRVGVAIKKAFDGQQDTVLFTDPDASCRLVLPRAYRMESALARWRDGSLIYRSEVSYDVWVSRNKVPGGY